VEIEELRKRIDLLDERELTALPGVTQVVRIRKDE
jgi:hypothetical protein